MKRGILKFVEELPDGAEKWMLGELTLVRTVFEGAPKWIVPTELFGVKSYVEVNEENTRMLEADRKFVREQNEGQRTDSEGSGASGEGARLDNGA